MGRKRGGSDIAPKLVDALSRAFASGPKKIVPYVRGVDQKKLLNARHMLKDMYDIAPNLAINKAVMRDALTEVATQQKAVWQFNKEDVEKFAKDQQPRIALMCRHLAQALLKSSVPQWATTIITGCDPPLEKSIKRSGIRKDDEDKAKKEQPAASV